MCGIVGYVGERRAAPILLDGLQRLEYRGYDSAGIAVMRGGQITVVRRKGRVKGLSEARSLEGKIGIGHTRWATHGVPSERNAHPHVCGKICIVHNGIIENAAALLRDYPVQRVLIVTSDYHLPRALALARDQGLEASGIGSTTLPEYWIKNHFREALSWIKYWGQKYLHLPLD